MRRKCDKCGEITGNIIVSGSGVVCWDCEKANRDGTELKLRRCAVCANEIEAVVGIRLCDDCFKSELVARSYKPETM